MPAPAVLKRAGECTRLGPTFTQDYSPFATLKCFLNELLVRSGYLLAIGAGLLLTAAFPKIGIAGCAWIAPALLIAAAYGKSGGDAFRVGYVAGLAHFLSSLCWLLLIPVPGFPILGWFALSAFIALYPAVWVWLVVECGRERSPEQDSWSRRTLWSLAGAAVWVALEMVRARFLGGFPWNPLGASQYQLIPLIQIASVTGVYGVSFLVVWLSLSLFSAGRMIFRRPASRFAWQTETFLPLAVVAVLFAVGFARMKAPDPSAATLRITLVQPSIPQALIWDPNANTNRFRQLLELSERALTNQTDLLIWPESAVPEFDEASFHGHHEPDPHPSRLADFQRRDSVEWRPEREEPGRLRCFQRGVFVRPGRSFQKRLSQAKAGHLWRIHPARALAAVHQMVHAHHRQLCGRHQAVPFEMEWWGERLSGRSQAKADPRKPLARPSTLSRVARRESRPAKR